MKESRRDPTRPDDDPLRRSAWTDVAFLIVVIGVIVAAVLFRGSHDTERGTPPATGAAAATVPEGRAGAIPFAFPGARDAVKRDLRNLVTAPEGFFADSSHYAQAISRLTADRNLNLTSGATIRIVWAAEAGWAATAQAVQLGGGSCVIRIGPVPESLRALTR